MTSFLRELFACDDPIVWKNAMRGMRYLCEATGSFGFLRNTIKKLIVEVEEGPKSEQDEADANE